MAIVLKKQKRVEKQVDQTQYSVISDLIEQAGALKPEADKIIAKIDALKKQLDPYTKAMGKLADAVKELGLDPAVEAQEISPNFVARIGKCSKKREVKDMAKVRELLGDEVFLFLAKVNLGDLDAYLTPPQLTQVIEEGYSESRKVTVEPVQK